VEKELVRAQTVRVLLLPDPADLSNVGEDLRCVVKESASFDDIGRIGSVGRDLVLGSHLEVFVSGLVERQVEGRVDRLLDSKHDVKDHVKVGVGGMHVVHRGFGRCRNVAS